MEIDIDINDIKGIITCNKCGIVLNTDIVKGKRREKYEPSVYICPLCKNKIVVYD